MNEHLSNTNEVQKSPEQIIRESLATLRRISEKAVAEEEEEEKQDKLDKYEEQS